MQDLEEAPPEAGVRPGQWLPWEEELQTQALPGPLGHEDQLPITQIYS